MAGLTAVVTVPWPSRSSRVRPGGLGTAAVRAIVAGKVVESELTSLLRRPNVATRPSRPCA